MNRYDEWVMWLQAQNRSQHTIKSYQRYTAKWLDWLGNREPSPALLSEWMLALEESGLKPTSRNLHLASVQSYCKYLGEDWGAKAKRAKVVVPEPNPYRQEDVVALAKRLTEGSNSKQKWRLRFILLAMCSTGLRTDELLSLRLEDVDFSTRELIVHGKGGKMRRVAVNQAMWEELIFYVDYVRPKFDTDLDLLIVSSEGNKLSRHSLWTSMQTLVPGMHPHRLRKTCATALHHAGCDIQQVADVLGHVSLHTTKRYVGTTTESRHQVMETINW